MNDHNTIFNLVNLIIALIFGIASIYLYFRATRRIRITYVEETCISLFHSVLQNIEGMAITYKGKAITTPLLFKLNGSFINDGNADIDHTKIFKPPTIRIPEGFRCIDVGVIASSKDIETKSNLISENEVEIGWNLLKKNEFIRCSLLIEALHANGNLEKQLSSKIILSHRIADLKKIIRENIALLQKPKKILDEFLPILMCIGIGIFFMWIAINPPTYHSGIVLQDEKGNKIEIEVYPYQIFGGENERNRLKNYLKTDIEIIEKRNMMFPYDDPTQDFTFGLSWALCALWYFFKQALNINRQRRLKRILNL